MSGLLVRAMPVAAVCVLADQAAKLLVRASLPPCGQFPILDCAHLRLGPLTLVRVRNTGTGYLFLRSPTLAVGLALAGCLLILVYAAWLRRATWVAALGVGLQAGGALSNLLDRFITGGANDYLNLTPTFTFNLADVFLLLGMTLAMAAIVRALVNPAVRAPRGSSPS